MYLTIIVANYVLNVFPKIRNGQIDLSNDGNLSPENLIGLLKMPSIYIFLSQKLKVIIYMNQSSINLLL